MTDMTITCTAKTAQQLARHRLSSRFFTVAGTSITASIDTWTLIATLHADPLARLPKQLEHVWNSLGCPQQVHLARKASAVKATVKTSTRRRAGLYTVALTNGAEATVSRNGAVLGDDNTGKWQWDDMAGGTDGHGTKAEALAQFIDYRG